VVALGQLLARGADQIRDRQRPRPATDVVLRIEAEHLRLQASQSSGQATTPAVSRHFVGTVSYIPASCLWSSGRNPVESSAPSGRASGHADPDLLFAWSSAMNIDLRDFPARDEQAARQALDEHPRPGYVRAHVLLLVQHVQADPARLVAAATAARGRHAELDGEGEPPQRLRRYLVAAALAERGLAMIREAGAEHDPVAQHQLVETISADLFPEPEPFRPGLFDRHRLPRRLARRLNLRWQYRRWTMRSARLDVQPAAKPDGIATITVLLHGEDIGKLSYQVCAACRKALICKESVDQEYQGLGLGRRALLAALATAPGYQWTTTPQYDISVRFWQRMSRATGASLTDDPAHAGPCPHMH
jgi:GNAT superfamily N-acetyltransferase